MLERARFRWLLPLVMTAVQSVLFAVTAVQERVETWQSVLSVPVVQAAVIQAEEGTVSFQPMAPIPARATVKAALFLNFPSVLGGVVLGGLFYEEIDSSITASAYCLCR